MSVFKLLRDVVTQEPYYVDSFSGQMYRRAVCTLAWPWHPYPGWVVVLGEYRHKPTTMGEARHLQILSETESQSPEELIRTVDRYLRQYHIPRVITPEEDKRVTLIDLENDKRRAEKKPYLRTESPINWQGKGEGLIPFYMALLNARINDAKTLFFGHASNIPSAVQYIFNAKSDHLSTMPMIEYPPVCALCWAIEAIDLNPMAEWGAGGSGMPSGFADQVGGY